MAKAFAAILGVVLLIGSSAAGGTEWGRAPNGEFWNGFAKRFIEAPAFGFARVDGAVSYAYEVIDDRHRVRTFVDGTPTASLKGVWPGLPVGYVTVVCRGIGADGSVKGEAGRRIFWKKSAFDGSYPPPTKTFALASSRVFDAYLGMEQTKFLMKHGKPDPDYYLSGYPSKMLSAQIEAIIRCADGLAGDFLAKRERLLIAAKRAADYLIAGAVPEGAALERFPRTYENGGEYGRFVGEEDRIMLCYPALCGRAFVHLFEATKDGKYLDAARRIAGTYIKLQGEDGTWFLLQNAVTGKEYAPNRLLPTDVLEFFEELHRVDGNDVYRRTADKVFAYIEKGPMSDWNWEGQFEDTRPSSVRWKNLTKHPACATAVYLLKRFPDDAVRLAQAEELVRFAEDQFVEWTAPYVGREETGDADDGSWDYFCLPHSRWMTPCALEQYYCYWPIDASAARLINTYLELWRTTRKHAYLAKARALGAAATRMQEPDGWINTWWIKGVERNDDRYHTWINCMLETALALSNLAKADKEEKTKTVICWGDSITEGMSMKAEDAYPSRLQGLLGEDYKVLNSGDGGENVVTIPARQGALPLKTAAAIAFAAGESKVQIGDGEDNGFRTDDGCRIKLTKPLGRDIPVNPVRIGDGSYRVLLDDFKWNTPGHPISYRLCIERADASAAKEIPAGTPVVFASSSAVKEAYCEVFLMGANGGWDNDIGKLIAGHRRMIARRGADRPYLVVVPYWGGITERQVADFKAAFGDHAVDFRAAAVACGLDPVSLMLRNRPDCHLNAAGYDFLARQVYERGQALGYW